MATPSAATVSAPAPAAVRHDLDLRVQWLLGLARPYCSGCGSREHTIRTSHMLYDQAQAQYLVEWGCTACQTRFATIHEEIPWLTP